MSDESATTEPSVEEWKLKRECLAPNWMSDDAWWNTARMKVQVARRSAAYFDFLFNNETGVYGFRPKNSWRLYPRVWIESFVTIQEKRTLRMVPFILNEAQRLLLATILRLIRRGLPIRVAILKARQEGMSTLVGAVLLWAAMTMPHTRVLLMGHKKDSAAIIKGRMAKMIEQLHKKNGLSWRIPLETNNRKEIELGRPIESVIIADSAEGPDYRGDTLRGFHAIEPAEWPDAKTKANAVIQVVPDAPLTFIIIEGTAKGDTGWFAETWKFAWRRQQYGETTSGTVACFYPWYIHQNYRWSVVNTTALPKETAREIKATLSEEEEKLLRQKYLRRGKGFVKVDVDQLAWRRWAIVEKCQNSIDHFHQEYPAYPEEAFLSSGMRFFSQKALAEQREKFAGTALWRGDTIDPDGERKMMRTLEEMEA